MHPWAHASVIGFYGAIATIDGDGVTFIHAPGAAFFFIFLFLIVAAITFVLREMKFWYSPFMTQRSYVIKTSLLAYLMGVFIYCGIELIINNIKENDDPIIAVIN